MRLRLIIILFTVIAIFVVGAAVFVWSGIYNVAASEPHWGITHWLLGKVRERSIVAHSKGIAVLLSDNPERVDMGFRNYHAMCRLCHNAPGYSRTEISKGLYPSPPDLASDDVVKQLSDAELYWVIKNGIKMTGMPAFGSTHSKDELWGMVVFVKRLPNLKPEEYDAMVKSAGLQEEKEDDHHHGHR